MIMESRRPSSCRWGAGNGAVRLILLIGAILSYQLLSNRKALHNSSTTVLMLPNQVNQKDDNRYYSNLTIITQSGQGTPNFLTLVADGLNDPLNTSNNTSYQQITANDTKIPSTTLSVKKRVDININDLLQNDTANTRSPSDQRRSAAPLLPQRIEYAYASLVAGCDPDDPAYHGFLYNVFLAIYSLWRSGSKAEFVVMIQMAAKSSHRQLPDLDLAMFSKLASNTTVHIKYLPKPTRDSFYQAMLSKFAVLNITEYRRVLFMDADVLPLCNLDYLFDLSEQGVLKDNLVISTHLEPAHGGFFMLRPAVGDYDQMLAIVERRHNSALMNSSHPFDNVMGWGHAIQADEEYVLASHKGKRYGRLWTFNGAYVDQGLLYHWVKHVKKDVSIVAYNCVENWAASTSNTSTATNMSVGSGFLERNISSVNITGLGCIVQYTVDWSRPPPYKDFIHFTGHRKPWFQDRVPDDVRDPMTAEKRHEVWFHLLRKANDEFALNLNMTNILTLRLPKIS